jgi:hypothetical protein
LLVLNETKLPDGVSKSGAGSESTVEPTSDALSPYHVTSSAKSSKIRSFLRSFVASSL